MPQTKIMVVPTMLRIWNTLLFMTEQALDKTA